MFFVLLEGRVPLPETLIKEELSFQWVLLKRTGPGPDPQPLTYIVVRLVSRVSFLEVGSSTERFSDPDLSL